MGGSPTDRHILDESGKEIEESEEIEENTDVTRIHSIRNSTSHHNPLGIV